MVAFMIFKQHLGCCVQSGQLWGQSGCWVTSAEASAFIRGRRGSGRGQAGGGDGTERRDHPAAPGGQVTMLEDSGNNIGCQPPRFRLGIIEGTMITLSGVVRDARVGLSCWLWPRVYGSCS